MSKDVDRGDPTAEVEEVIQRLLAWNELIGGWEAKVWREAERFQGVSDAKQVEILKGLVDWEANMGGFEAPVWGAARSLVDRLRSEASADEGLSAPRM